jgi:hypothetical protein
MIPKIDIDVCTLSRYLMLMLIFNDAVRNKFPL